jgi:hypothetical protein
VTLLEMLERAWVKLIERPAPTQDWLPEPERVADPKPPLRAHVTVCGKCASQRGDGWTYSFRKANENTPVSSIALPVRNYGDLPRRRVLSVCSRPEHIKVTCRCGHSWLELTAEAIHGKIGQDFQPFPTFMQAWEWLRTTADYDEAFPLCDAARLVDRAWREVAESEEGRALHAAAVEVLRREGALSS